MSLLLFVLCKVHFKILVSVFKYFFELLFSSTTFINLKSSKSFLFVKCFFFSVFQYFSEILFYISLIFFGTSKTIHFSQVFFMLLIFLEFFFIFLFITKLFVVFSFKLFNMCICQTISEKMLFIYVALELLAKYFRFFLLFSKKCNFCTIFIVYCNFVLGFFYFFLGGNKIVLYLEFSFFFLFLCKYCQ